METAYDSIKVLVLYLFLTGWLVALFFPFILAVIGAVLVLSYLTHLTRIYLRKSVRHHRRQIYSKPHFRLFKVDIRRS